METRPLIVERLSDRFDLIIDQRIADWVAQRIPDFGCGADFGPCVALGIGMGGELVAGCIYNSFQPAYKSIELSMAATTPAWAKRVTIAALLGYPFDQLQVNRVTTYTRKSNERALRLNAGLGFVREGIVRQGYGDEDAVIMGLLRSDAEKWLRGEKSTKSA